MYNSNFLQKCITEALSENAINPTNQVEGPESLKYKYIEYRQCQPHRQRVVATITGVFGPSEVFVALLQAECSGHY